MIARFCMTLLALSLSASSGFAADFGVTTQLDAPDSEPGDGVCATGEGACSLRAAVQEANALPGHDVIVLPAGLFALTVEGRDEDASASGDLDVLDTLTLTGMAAQTTLVDGNGIDTVLQIHPGAGTVRIEGIGLVRGDYRLPPACNVVDCPGAGGLIVGAGVEVTVRDVDLRENVSVGFASALLNRGCLHGDRLRVIGNRNADSGFSLAPILTDPNADDLRACLRLDHSEIAANGVAGDEMVVGAIYADDSDIVLKRSLVRDNVGQWDGAFLFNTDNEVLIENTTIIDNTGGSGLMLNDGGSTVHIRHCTITGNTGGITGGIHDVHSGFGLVTLSNTLLTGNRLTTGEPSDCRRGLISMGGLVTGAPVIPTMPSGPDQPCWVQPGPADQTDTFLDLGEPADHGGATHSLLPAGSAIDAGIADQCAALDQRDFVRPAGKGCDIGAVELDALNDRLFDDGFDG
jgi:hypothetical protein